MQMMKLLLAPKTNKIFRSKMFFISGRPLPLPEVTGASERGLPTGVDR